ncbi:MAG: thioredoxin family protein [Chthoniobacterales bacterium]
MRRLAIFLTCAVFCGTMLGADIYDPKADGKKLIASALELAKKENRHVLLDFGANWCPPCHSLHQLFQSNTAIREKLAASYVLVMIDTNEDRNHDVNLRYGTPTLRGLPVLVVLDSGGNQVFTQDTSGFESGKNYDAKKVLAFLNKW